MFWKFLCSLSEFSLRRSVSRVDALGVTLSPMVYFSAKISGYDLPEKTGDIILVFIGGFAASVFFLRFLTSPYFLWKEQKIRADQAEMTVEKLRYAQIHSKDRMDSAKRIRISVGNLVDAALNCTDPNKYLEYIKENNMAIDIAVVNDERIKVLEKGFPKKLAILWAAACKFHSGEIDHIALLKSPECADVLNDKNEIESICDKIISECAGHR